MQSNKSQINDLVINQLALHYKCRWDKETHPEEYAALVDAFMQAIYDTEIEPGYLAARMTAFKATWKYARWPNMAELLDFLRPAEQSKISAPEIPRAKWAEEVMRLPEGQQALQEGFGRELYLWAEKNQGVVPGVVVMDECHAAEQRFRALFRKQIDAARNLNHSREEPMKELVHSVVLTAGSAMDGFENKLKKEFLI